MTPDRCPQFLFSGPKMCAYSLGDRALRLTPPKTMMFNEE
jgi:hypothetical protein